MSLKHSLDNFFFHTLRSTCLIPFSIWDLSYWCYILLPKKTHNSSSTLWFEFRASLKCLIKSTIQILNEEMRERSWLKWHRCKNNIKITTPEPLACLAKYSWFHLSFQQFSGENRYNPHYNINLSNKTKFSFQARFVFVISSFISISILFFSTSISLKPTYIE